MTLDSGRLMGYYGIMKTYKVKYYEDSTFNPDMARRHSSKHETIVVEDGADVIKEWYKKHEPQSARMIFMEAEEVLSV